MSGNALFFVLVFLRFCLDLVSIWVPFWLHLGAFFSSTSNLFGERVQDGLQEAFGSIFKPFGIDFGRSYEVWGEILEGFGEIFGRTAVHPLSLGRFRQVLRKAWMFLKETPALTRVALQCAGSPPSVVK